jgi:predicted dehydrogenase
MLKVGISGAGYAGRYFVKALKDLGCPIVGVANRTRERGEELAREAGTRFYPSVDELALYSDAEMLLVATSTERHVADIKAAAAAGIKNILCEKPVGVSPEETEQIREIVEKYGVNVGVGYKMRFEGIFKTARRLVEAGRIGAPVSATFNFYQTIPHSTWYLDSGFVRETMVHPIDLACWFAGVDPEYVMCHTERFAGGKKEDRASLIVHYRNGMTASLNGGWIQDYPFVSGRKNIRFEIVGKGGYICGIRPGHLLICDADGIQNIDFEQTDPIQNELTDFIMRVENGQPAAVGLNDAKRVQGIVKAAAASEISGRTEKIQASD